MELDAFAHACIACALWGSMDNSTPSGRDPLDANCDITDVASEALERVVADCRQFQEAHAELLERAY